MGFNSGFKGLNISYHKGWVSVVGIATCYRLGGKVIEYRWGQDFVHLFRPALKPTPPPSQWVKWPRRGVNHSPSQSAEVKKVTQRCTFVAGYGVNFTFTFYIYIIIVLLLLLLLLLLLHSASVYRRVCVANFMYVTSVGDRTSSEAGSARG